MADARTLLLRVHRRLWLRAAARAWWRGFVIASVVWLAAWLAQLWSGVGPELATWTVALVPVVAALLAIPTFTRPSTSAAAAAADVSAGTPDLFLTSAWLAPTAGEFERLVAARADERAAVLRAEQIVPMRPWPRLVVAAAVLLAFGAGTQWLPRIAGATGGENAVEQAKARQQQGEEARLRITALRAAQVGEPQSPTVTAAVAELQQVLQQTQRAAVAANQTLLQEQRRALGEAWRAANREAAATGGASGAQDFGARMDARLQEWRRELERGEADAVASEIDQLRKELGAMPSTAAGDHASRVDELRRRLEDLADLASAAGRGGPADRALAQALQQLQQLAADGLSPEDAAALQESLDLAKLEFEAQAQDVRDRDQLERALRTMQLASRLNELGDLDGEDTGACRSLADYEQMYEQRLRERLAAGESAACSRCNGTGQHEAGACAACAGSGRRNGVAGVGAAGGQGLGQGGKVPEDPSGTSSFTPEPSRAALNAGRMLMQTNGKGVADVGVPQREYDEALQQVRQGSTEAILQERVPPGYHDGIRKYFDELGRRNR